MGVARKVFDHIPVQNIAFCNILLKGYAQNEFYKEVIFLFRHMNFLSVKPNYFTFPMVLKSCLKLSARKEGEEVHCAVMKFGVRSNLFVSNTLIEMYSGVGQLEFAHRVFSEMAVRNVVAWTTMINAYLLVKNVISARRLFDLAPDRDIILWNTMVSGYIDCGDTAAARELFDSMPNRDIMSWNTMLNGYEKNGDVEGCKRLFEKMPERNIFSWNGLIGAFAHNGHHFEIIGAFERMLNESNVSPNYVTLVSVLSACAKLGALDLGKWVHLYVEINGYRQNIYVENGLIDMYAKCGMIESAVSVFRNMVKKDLISWNTIINGLAVHGYGGHALSFFNEMRDAGEQPDGITFLGILCSFSHLGLVEDGLTYFNSMINIYSITPHIEHYGCVVDMLARAGLLEQAVEFVKNMPMKTDSVIWTALLGSCRVHKNTELAELALSRLIELEPGNPSYYVILSNIYGEARRWNDLARLKLASKDTGTRKVPGCSLIEVNNDVVEFYSFDERHPMRADIYDALRGLTVLLRLSRGVPVLLEIS